ncbi:MAG: dienelactone hydrolase family protein [Rhizobiales bacterium]|nr:dienelactone hydrolase family protein [Hyphomicrobiales bacterium]
MIEETVTIPTPAGAMETFTVRPADGAYPPVIIYMDAIGIREELHDFARRIAAEGYYVLLPDMYYRRGHERYEWPCGEEMLTRMAASMNSLNNALVMEDTGAMLAFLKTSPAALPGPRGCIGYCMSGQYVVSAMGHFPDDFAAGASLYGVGIVTDKADSPHLLAPKIKGALYFGFAETDKFVPDEVIPTLKSALDDNGVTYRLDICPGTEHGFCFPSRASYVETQAEKTWVATFELYAKRLTPKA